MIRSDFALGLLLLSLLVVSCGRPPGVANNYAGYERPGIASAVTPPSATQQAVDAQKKQLDELNAKINQQLDRDRQMTSTLADLKSQIGAAQSVASALQENSQDILTQKTQESVTADLDAQRQQLELEIVRTQIKAQIAAQENQLAQLGGVVQQQQNWGFPTSALEENSAQYAAERENLATLESQYWSTQQQAGQIAALHSESQRRREGEDQQQVSQHQSQVAEQNKQVQSLIAQYDKVDQQQQELRNSIGTLEGNYKIARDNYQTLQDQLPR
jgi:chromosome segregation ATPase